MASVFVVSMGREVAEWRGLTFSLETVLMIRSRDLPYLVVQSLSSSVATYSSAPNFSASSRLLCREIATTLSAPRALAKRIPNWPSPPMPMMPTFFPGPQPFLVRGEYKVIPPQSMGPASAGVRPWGILMTK